MYRFAAVLVLALAATPATAAEPVRLYAAGSLAGALGAVADAFTTQTGIPVERSFGPSGMMRERIEKGEPVDVFASADMGHPRRLVAEGHGDAVVRFTGNRLCAIARPEIGLTGDNFLDKALDPAVRLGTSTPKSDPSGDYTWAMFAAAETLRTGARAALEAKALQLVGGPRAEPVPAGKSAVPYMFETGRADLFVAYCTTGRAARASGLALTVVDLAPPLAQTADYGLVVTNPASADADRFALFVLSEPARVIFSEYGFAASAP